MSKTHPSDTQQLVIGCLEQMPAPHGDVQIVIVEDEPAIASALRVQLSLLGYGETRWAQNRAGALRLIEEEEPDLVIMDIQLADGDDGAQVAFELRQSLNIPSVFLTAYTDDATIERCKAAEPAGYLLKPFNLQLLKVTLEMALHREGAIRARAEAEAQKRRTESLYRAIFENAPVAILSASSEGTVVKANPSAQHLFDRDSDEFTGVAVGSLLREPPTLQTGVTHGTTVAFARGRPIPVAVCALRFDYEGEHLTNYFVSDQRERLALEAQLAHAHQSDVIAALTSGVAHDLNNLLGSLQALQFLLEQSRDHSTPTPATALEQVVERGSWLTDQLVQLSQHMDDDVQSLDLYEFLQHSSHLFQRLLGEGRTVTIVNNYPSVHIHVSPQKLRRTLSHVLRNARQATGPTGLLTLSIQRAADHKVELLVIDDGVGMPSDVAERAFEPFFTTRSGDEVYGLGLPIVKRTIESLSGSVSLHSRVGEGTTVTIRLPTVTPQQDT